MESHGHSHHAEDTTVKIADGRVVSALLRFKLKMSIQTFSQSYFAARLVVRCPFREEHLVAHQKNFPLYMPPR